MRAHRSLCSVDASRVGIPLGSEVTQVASQKAAGRDAKCEGCRQHTSAEARKPQKL